MHINSHPSPNHNERPSGVSVDMLIMHYTGMKTGQAALQRMCDCTAEVSAHYMVEEDGAIYQLVGEGRRAWHAGVAFWRGNRDINARSIGIEIVNPGHEWGYRAFPGVQMDSVLWLSQQILTRHKIPARNVVGHSDVAPARKQDPGELFPWQWFAQNGVGLWPGQASRPKTRLCDLGYENEGADAVLAFQRHFMANHLTGMMDEKTQQMLDRVGGCLSGR